MQRRVHLGQRILRLDDAHPLGLGLQGTVVLHDRLGHIVNDLLGHPFMRAEPDHGLQRADVLLIDLVGAIEVLRDLSNDTARDRHRLLDAVGFHRLFRQAQQADLAERRQLHDGRVRQCLRRHVRVGLAVLEGLHAGVPVDIQLGEITARLVASGRVQHLHRRHRRRAARRAEEDALALQVLHILDAAVGPDHHVIGAQRVVQDHPQILEQLRRVAHLRVHVDAVAHEVIDRRGRGQEFQILLGGIDGLAHQRAPRGDLRLLAQLVAQQFGRGDGEHHVGRGLRHGLPAIDLVAGGGDSAATGDSGEHCPRD